MVENSSGVRFEPKRDYCSINGQKCEQSPSGGCEGRQQSLQNLPCRISCSLSAARLLRRTRCAGLFAPPVRTQQEVRWRSRVDFIRSKMSQKAPENFVFQNETDLDGLVVND